MQRSGEFLWHQILTLKRHPEGWVTRDGIGLSGATTLQKISFLMGFFIFFLSSSSSGAEKDPFRLLFLLRVSREYNTFR